MGRPAAVSLAPRRMSEQSIIRLVSPTGANMKAAIAGGPSIKKTITVINARAIRGTSMNTSGNPNAVESVTNSYTLSKIIGNPAIAT